MKLHSKKPKLPSPPGGSVVGTLLILALLFTAGCAENFRGPGKTPEQTFRALKAAFAEKNYQTIFELSSSDAQRVFLDSMLMALTVDLAKVNNIRLISPEARRKIEDLLATELTFCPKRLEKKELDRKSSREYFAEMAKKPAVQKNLDQDMAALADAEFVSTTMVDDTHAIVTVTINAQGDTRPIPMQKVNDAWFLESSGESGDLVIW